MIDKEQWSTLPADVKGDIYEGLLERNAQDVKGGAGQYFTPRPLIQAMVEVMQPAVQGRTNVAGGRMPGATNSGYVVADPACGTGGFLLAAHDYMAAQATSKKEQRHLKEHALRGNDIVDGVVRLCAMRNSGTPTNLNSQKWHKLKTLFEFNFMGVPDFAYSYEYGTMLKLRNGRFEPKKAESGATDICEKNGAGKISEASV
jgi:N-6 DNA Methylase